MDPIQYICAKCDNPHYTVDRFHATGGLFAKFFDIQNKKFVTVSCTRCGYTELFRQNTSAGANILDFLIGR